MRSVLLKANARAILIIIPRVEETKLWAKAYCSMQHACIAAERGHGYRPETDAPPNSAVPLDKTDAFSIQIDRFL